MKLFDRFSDPNKFSDGELIASTNYWQSMLNGPDNKPREYAASSDWINNIRHCMKFLEERGWIHATPTHQSSSIMFGQSDLLFKRKEDIEF